MSEIMEGMERRAGYRSQMRECRCCNCKRLLGKFCGKAEVKCPKCGVINRIEVKMREG